MTKTSRKDHIKALRGMKVELEKAYADTHGAVRLLKAIFDRKDAPPKVEQELDLIRSRIRSRVDAIVFAIAALEGAK